ncbi:MAG TPA: acyl-CoA dehydratase activase [Candidatus Cloacimonadota bacterium]|jgi:predicted CoA-substrate-specific enzyme activase|nr:acyl-CoA dehydratase activase [Candidatus Cloacimonadota bacterium]HQL14109.1 acyl-CoA dehydratase activase [Candidatus Cloacimonadota bacterium]HQO44100.1 acyl-CoA dehydratase activase [Candidatus Cloacimonadota bacterium]HQP17810.1 acyl-CoA dehydratase activase [Candidatus Cloacimonadota bacterium]HRS50659.1 acyl-CoA dehydratase activase [Candidatus Cloacimonadota bacterium]
MIAFGIDIGSRNTKLVVLDSVTRALLFSGWQGTDVSPMLTVQALIDKARQECGIGMPDRIGCTGYGRKLFDQPCRILSEISCHAAGVGYFHPDCRSVIDIGGQDSKIITLRESGKVEDFAMNDKCAAGTGRFLELTALHLDCGIDRLSDLAWEADAVLSISSTCVVFAESEIIGLISRGEKPANIARAVHVSIAKRIRAQIGALEMRPPVYFTGGVAMNADLALCLSEQLQQEVHVSLQPEITGALGAALIAAES